MLDIFPNTSDVAPAYRGRFAPSPSGPLHFGSIVAAVGSYLQAKKSGGNWFLRIDDIDPPRQDKNAIDAILRSLEAHNLYWDGEVHYQGKQTTKYESVLNWLEDNGLSYLCQCTRKQIHALGGIYQGTCRDLGLVDGDCSVRFRNNTPASSFDDELLGRIDLPEEFASEDFIVRRKDGLFAYHLASVVDDIQQGITEVVRGADLIYPSGCQLALFKTLGAKPPSLLHLPVAVSAPGRKLSKQGHAKPLQDKFAGHNLYLALKFLGLEVPEYLQRAKPGELLDWGLKNWDLNNLHAKSEIILPDFLVEVDSDVALF